MSTAPGTTIRVRPWTRIAALCALGLTVQACAARRVGVPGDAGTPFPDFAAVHAQVSAPCTGTRTFTAELSLSGRAGSERLRGRVIAGFERPDRMRLEGVAPFGPPAFILAARGDMAVLLLPRERRVLRGVRADEILGALTGVALGPSDLQAILTGCVTPAPQAASGRRHANGWVSLELTSGAVVYLEMRNGGWEIRAARRAGWQIEYGQWENRYPVTVRLISGGEGPPVDLTASMSQLEANVDIVPEAFTVDVPADVDPLSIEELREAGPLRGATE